MRKLINLKLEDAESTIMQWAVECEENEVGELQTEISALVDAIRGKFRE